MKHRSCYVKYIDHHARKLKSLQDACLSCSTIYQCKMYHNMLPNTSWKEVNSFLLYTLCYSYYRSFADIITSSYTVQIHFITLPITGPCLCTFRELLYSLLCLLFVWLPSNEHIAYFKIGVP